MGLSPDGEQVDESSPDQRLSKKRTRSNSPSSLKQGQIYNVAEGVEITEIPNDQYLSYKLMDEQERSQNEITAIVQDQILAELKPQLAGGGTTYFSKLAKLNEDAMKEYGLQKDSFNRNSTKVMDSKNEIDGQFQEIIERFDSRGKKMRMRRGYIQ